MKMRTYLYIFILSAIMISFFNARLQVDKFPMSQGRFHVQHDFFPEFQDQYLRLVHQPSQCEFFWKTSASTALYRGQSFWADIQAPPPDDSQSYFSPSCWKETLFLSEKEFQVRINSVSPSPYWQHNLSHIRHQLAIKFQRIFRGPLLQYSLGLMLGIKSLIPRQERILFKDFGLLYLLAISGFHIQILYGSIHRFSYLIPGQPSYKTAILLIPFMLYIPISGWGPAVARAVLSQFYYYLNDLTESGYSVFQIWWTTLLSCLLIEPRWIFHLGFQLSFIATLCIQQMSWIRFEPQVLQVSVRAICGTYPLLMWYFGALPLFSLVSQSITLFLVTLCFALGLPYLLIQPWLEWKQGLDSIHYAFDQIHHFHFWLLELLKPINQAFTLELPSWKWLTPLYCLWLVLSLIKSIQASSRKLSPPKQ